MATPDDKDLGQQPATPTTTMVEHMALPTITGGLTKREHFAGLCLQGLLANPHVDGSAPEAAVKYAERLIAELAKGGAK